MSQAGINTVSSSTGIVETLTGNTGGPIGPDSSDNINVVGTGVISVAGSGNTLTISSSAGSGITAIDGDSGSITGSTVTIYANNSTQNCGSSVSFVNSGTTSTLNIADANSNVIIGKGAGNSSITATGCTSLGTNTLVYLTSGVSNTTIGTASLEVVTTGRHNTSVGSSSLASLTTTSDNTSVGNSSLTALTTGAENTSLGATALSNLLTGSLNIGVGFNSGTNYTGSESNNIIIGNAGTALESNVIRIGTQGSGAGQQNTCYIAGIEGVSVSNLNYVTINTSTGQLGSTSSVTIPPLTITSVAHAASPYTVLSTDQFLACQTSGGVITILLPNAPTTGRVIYIKDSNGAAVTSNISVTTVGGTVTIDGQTTYTMATNYQSINVVFDGTNYEVF